MVNNLELPYDIKQIINGFCFYDAKTWELVERKKQFMKEVNQFFSWKNLSRSDNYNYEWCWWVLPEYDDYDENDDLDMSLMSGANCIYCGNFITIQTKSLWIQLPDKIKCTSQTCLRIGF